MSQINCRSAGFGARPRTAQGGFSLMELMVVVVIIGILATLAFVGYGKWIGRARKGEAAAMLAEMSAKEQIYLMEFGAYLPLRNDGVVTINPPPANEAPAAFYPIAPDNSGFNSVRVATLIEPTTWPAAWRNVGMRPKRNATYCTYLLNAGAAGQAVPGGATIGASLLGPGDTATNWFYALGACNMSGPAGWPSEVSVLVLTHNSMVLRELNEGR